MNKRKTDSKRVPVSFSLAESQLSLIDSIRDAAEGKSRTDVIMEGVKLLYEKLSTSPNYASGFGIDAKQLRRGA